MDHMSDGLYLILILVSILMSMTIHEAMHAYVSYWLGDDTALRMGRLTLNPVAHIDPFTTVLLPIMLAMVGLPPFGAAKPVPFNPYRVKYGEFGAALVGVAGPLTNLFLAMFAGGLIRILGVTNGLTLDIMGTFVLVNLAFFVFNMIPYPPLDGSRLLYAFAPAGLQKLMRQIEQAGLAAIFIFMLFAYSFIAPMVGRAITILMELIIGRSVIL